jgi:glycine hydroxymethyltransferase
VADRLSATLRASLHEQEELLRSSLVLNPVENFPFPADLEVTAGTLHGLYNTDKVRTREQRLETPMQFAGRTALERDSRLVYEAWADALGAADTTMRVLSGLHAHIVLFMAMARPGETVLLLPVQGGGHLSGQAIIERLGLCVIEMPTDDEAMSVDMPAALELCEKERPDYVLVDRSEGLVYEDFSEFAAVEGPTKIFDASQYLTNVICGDHPNPFEWGYDLMVASVHKNFPGPQKALLATRQHDERWKSLLKGVSTFVSNMHVASTYAAGLTLSRREWLQDYSRRMLRVAVKLEDALDECGVPVVRRRRDLPPTHHVWIREHDRDSAFTTYERLERCLIMTNFRTLPYSLGQGIRIGVNSAVRLGLIEDDVPRLAELIAMIRAAGPTPSLREEAFAFNQMIWSRAALAHDGVPEPG